MKALSLNQDPVVVPIGEQVASDAEKFSISSDLVSGTIDNAQRSPSGVPNIYHDTRGNPERVAFRRNDPASRPGEPPKRRA